ncbi:MAG: hypothetical protein ACYC3P_07710 [Bellilinea sp.]
MTSAVSINRQWVIVLNNGDVVIDWGDGVFQDVMNGAFLPEVDQTGSHPVQDNECAWLEKAGAIQGFDKTQVYVYDLPARSKKSLE